MRTIRTIIPLAVMLALGANVACNKPAPAPKIDEDAAKRAAEEAARKAAEEEAARRAAEEASRRAAEAEAARKAAEAEAARKAAAEAEAAYRRVAEAALKNINFDFDKSSIREADKAKLQAIAEFMKAYPQAKLRIEGHCDERGTVEYNLALGDRRASAAKSYLASLGVAELRLDTLSFGKEKPLADGHGEKIWFENRRAEFKLQ